MSFVGSEPPVELGTVKVIAGETLKVDCLYHDGKRCTAWFPYSESFVACSHAADVWLYRAHAFALSPEEHAAEARRVRGPLRDQWRLAREARLRASPSGAASSGDVF